MKRKRLRIIQKEKKLKECKKENSKWHSPVHQEFLSLIVFDNFYLLFQKKVNWREMTEGVMTFLWKKIKQVHKQKNSIAHEGQYFNEATKWLKLQVR